MWVNFEIIYLEDDEREGRVDKRFRKTKEEPSRLTASPVTVPDVAINSGRPKGRPGRKPRGGGRSGPKRIPFNQSSSGIEKIKEEIKEEPKEDDNDNSETESADRFD